MRKIILATLVIIGLAGATAIWWIRRGPDPSQFAELREPRFTRLNDQRMLVVEAAGDPNLVAQKAFKSLFNIYFKLDGVSRMTPPAPRARWRLLPDTPRDQWVGFYALPVTESVTAVPAITGADALPATLTTWKYGDVAEILHVGPYSAEQPNIERLHAFIAAQGYTIVGDHEEEYVSGPGMVFAGDPAKYLTIIRSQVAKRAE